MNWSQYTYFLNLLVLGHGIMENNIVYSYSWIVTILI